MGVLAFLSGDPYRAAEYFARGGALGMANAAELQKHLNSVGYRW